MFISKKYYHIVFAGFMSFIMSAIISLIGVFGQTTADTFLFVWLASWIKSYVVAFPISVTISPLVRKIAEKFTY